MEDKLKVGCLYCEFKTKTSESLQQHMNIKHKTEASNYEEAMKMLGTPAMESIVKSMQNLQREKEEKEQMVVKLEKDFQAAQNQLKVLEKSLGEKTNALEKAEEEISRKSQEVQQETENKVLEYNTNVLQIKAVKSKVTETDKTKDLVTSDTEEKEQKDKLKDCRYFNKLKGCKRGDSCHFLHEEKKSELKDCRFWMEGRCKFPDSVCWNKHNSNKKSIKLKKLPNQSNQEKENQTNMINMLTQLLLRFVLQSSA